MALARYELARRGDDQCILRQSEICTISDAICGRRKMFCVDSAANDLNTVIIDIVIPQYNGNGL